jgi:hypothetical protein
MAELAENMVIFIVGFVQPKRSRSPKHWSCCQTLIGYILFPKGPDSWIGKKRLAFH